MVNVASNLHSIDYGTATQPTLSETGQDDGAITVKASTRVFNICWMFFFCFFFVIFHMSSSVQNSNVYEF